MRPSARERSFATSQTFDTIREHYDEVWIYGEQSVFDAVEEYGFPDDVAALTHYCGYLRASVEVPPRADSRRTCSSRPAAAATAAG